MRKTFLILSLLCIVIASCKKTPSTPQITYEVDGIQDISMQNMVDSSKYLAIAVNHITGQAQETVTITISGLPNGINMVTTTGSLTGIPTFSSIITFYDTTTFGATPGTYPITITCKGTESGIKTFTFNLTITAAPNYNTLVLGNYSHCALSLQGQYYDDSVYADASITNKIWFTNFMNTGQKVYGAILGTDDSTYALLYIPAQTVNGFSFSFVTSTNGSTPFDAEYKTNYTGIFFVDLYAFINSTEYYDPHMGR